MIIQNYTDANFLVVEDVLKALQQLAVFHRRQFNIPVIGITGSNGKNHCKKNGYINYCKIASILLEAHVAITHKLAFH